MQPSCWSLNPSSHNIPHTSIPTCLLMGRGNPGSGKTSRNKRIKFKTASQPTSKEGRQASPSKQQASQPRCIHKHHMCDIPKNRLVSHLPKLQVWPLACRWPPGVWAGGLITKKRIGKQHDEISGNWQFRGIDFPEN